MKTGKILKWFNAKEELIMTHVKQAQLLDLKALTLNVFATNKRTIRVYEKTGFVKICTIPKNIIETANSSTKSQ